MEVIRAWSRLDQAIASFHGHWSRCREWGPRLQLAELRRRPVMHPATTMSERGRRAHDA